MVSSHIIRPLGSRNNAETLVRPSSQIFEGWFSIWGGVPYRICVLAHNFQRKKLLLMLFGQNWLLSLVAVVFPTTWLAAVLARNTRSHHIGLVSLHIHYIRKRKNSLVSQQNVARSGKMLILVVVCAFDIDSLPCSSPRWLNAFLLAALLCRRSIQREDSFWEPWGFPTSATAGFGSKFFTYCAAHAPSCMPSLPVGWFKNSQNHKRNPGPRWNEITK